MNHEWNEAKISDISGGGIRFQCTGEIKQQMTLEFKLPLKENNRIQMIQCMASVIEVFPSMGQNQESTVRCQFEGLDKQTQEKIIKYIFEEQKRRIRKDKMPMGNVSYSAHISNGKSAITSKKALAGVAKHNLRKYKSADYSSDNIRLIYGTTDLFQDVKRVYHREFDDVVKEYNSRQKREDRKIKDYFEHVAGLNQDMAVEIIFQCGDKKYWDEHWKNKNYMSEVFDYILECLQKLLPEFKIANAVIHFDEASPHMHVVGVPVWEGAKRGLSKKVSKRNVFTPQTLSVILQDKLRAEASYGFECYFKEQLAEKKKGRNHDLSVTEYKVAQESRKLADIKQQNNEEQEKNTKLRSNNASISYQIATQEQCHSRNLDVIAADEDRLETVRSSINAAETEYAKYEDMITDKKNNLELLSSKESELIERTKIAENVYDMFRQGGTDDVREKLIDVMYENQKLREENTTLKELLEKAYEFMKQFVIDGVNLLERFLESVGKMIGKIR